jgi:LCP family protein required for cell wall assembly
MRKKTKKSSPAVRVAKGAFYSLFLVACVGVGAVAGWVHQSPLAEKILRSKIQNIPPQEAFGGADHQVVLLLGCDEDLAPGGKKLLKSSARADMILLANLDFVNKRITGLSIPRDLRVKMPHQPAHKMNSFYHSAAPGHEEEDQKRAVEYMFPEVHIDKVLTVNYQAFQQLVNMVDGVTLNVDKQMDYDDKVGNVHAHFKPGVAHLDGYQAEMFVRFRHSDDDHERQKRQKEFLVAFKDALMSHKARIMQIAEMGKKVFGETLTDDQIASLVNFSGGIDQKDIKLSEIPSHAGSGTWVLLDKGKVEPALREYGLVSGDESRLTHI